EYSISPGVYAFLPLAPSRQYDSRTNSALPNASWPTSPPFPIAIPTTPQSSREERTPGSFINPPVVGEILTKQRASAAKGEYLADSWPAIPADRSPMTLLLEVPV